MDKKTLLILCLTLALVLIGAGVLYNTLAGSVRLDGIATMPPGTQMPDAPTEENPAQATEASPTEPVNNTAPDFTMLDGEGNEVTLAAFFGKPIILNFWASWCGPCKMEMPDLQKFYEKYGEEIHFLLVNCTDGSRETLDTARAFIDKSGYTFPVYFDTTSVGAYTYGTSSIPLTYFIDAQGNLVAYYMGAMSENVLQQGVDMIYAPEATE